MTILISCVEDDEYRFVDDISVLEVINLFTFGVTSYNFLHGASGIVIGQLFL